ncbi:uncharacterized protein LOC117327388 isoform X2 [Pecten maximus]|uniref:uncharacterized protein LOC117327388 isoform X2 n=1 Tax=Pecten maximus TaxID=6579 RepID=UPI001458879E|nr:uncharacterized protein LOC117327388 isoform X2 [Pecten maximus]
MNHAYVVGILALSSCYQGVQCKVCSEAAAATENTDVIRMCESGSLITRRVVIDIFDTGHPDVYSCTCNARPVKADTNIVNFGRSYLVKQAIECGSRLSVKSSEHETVGFECVGPDKVYSMKSSFLDFVLSRTDRNNPWRYGYCILLEITKARWNITCLPPVKVTTKIPISTTTPQSTSTTTAVITTGSWYTESPSSVSATQTSSLTTPETNTEKICSTKTVEVFSTATVVIPIVVVVLIVAVATIANVILYRRRLALEKEEKNEQHDLKPAASVVYDSIDIDRLEPQHTYADTTAGRMYANTSAVVTVS